MQKKEMKKKPQSQNLHIEIKEKKEILRDRGMFGDDAKEMQTLL